MVWILDLRATNHMTPFPKLFNSYVKMTREPLITTANGDSVPKCESVNITLESFIALKNVLCPTTNSLISIQKI